MASQPRAPQGDPEAVAVPPTLGRRRFLQSAGVLTVAGVLPGGLATAGADHAQESVRVYVVVVDGLRPDEVAIMPTVSGLAAAGTFYPAGRAQMVAETTPNHVSMLTGLRADRHGMPGNDVPFLDGNVGDDPRYLQADSVFTLARRQAPDLVTAAITAKSYLVAMSKHDRTGSGAEDATSTNNPVTTVPVSDAAIDLETANDALRISRELDPDFLFLNLGDVDRVGHVDVGGGATEGTAPLARTLAVLQTDTLLGNLVRSLEQEGKWSSTVFIVTADHSMDWSFPDRIVSLAPQFATDDSLAGEVTFALNGGAALYALRSPLADGADEQRARLRAIALATDGVEEAWYIRPNAADGDDAHWVGRTRPDWGLTGDRTGDLIVTVADGWRVTEPEATSNPIPGNHGHGTTLPIPVIVAGGWPGVVGQRVEPIARLGPADRDPAQAENIDLGATAAWLLRLHPPPGGFDGRVLEEAFSRRPSAPVTVRDVPSLPQVERVAGVTRYATAAALSARAFEAGAPIVVVASGEHFPDALAATALAATLGAPLLLATEAGLPAEAGAEVARLGAEAALLVGGTGVLSEQVMADLVAAGVPGDAVRRIAGDDRYATAAAVAREIAVAGTFDGAAVVASGEDFPDGLAAGLVAGRRGRPVLLTPSGALAPAASQAIADTGISRVVVAGGPAAVSAAVVDELRAAGLVVERLGGEDRYATAVALTERAVREAAHTDVALLVSGADFPDALAAGAAAAALRGLLIPVAPTGLHRSPASAALLAARADQFVRLLVVGGEGALPTRLVAEVGALVATVRTRHR